MSDLSPHTGGSGPAAQLTWKPSSAVRLARKPVLYWALAALLAMATALTVLRSINAADAAKAAYGETAIVFVTTGQVSPSNELEQLVQPQAVPLTLLPDDAVRELPTNPVARRSISAGAILTGQDLGPSADLGATEAALALPTGQSTPALSTGQAILILINADPFSGLESAQVTARVYSVEADQLTVAIQRNDLVALSAALATGSITIALV